MTSKDQLKRIMKRKAEKKKQELMKIRSHKLKENLPMLRNITILKEIWKITLKPLFSTKLLSDNATTSKMKFGRGTLQFTIPITFSFTSASMLF